MITVDRAYLVKGTEQTKIKTWLMDTVKLPQYYHIFIDQGFDDLETIRCITRDDLKAIGIDKVGHQRKIMKYAHQLNLL